MSKKTDSQRRLRLWSRGNSQCPICLANFTRTQVASGKKVTLEHAPPEALGGRVVCLTCNHCNNRASRLDHLTTIAERAKHDHVSGRGTKVEVDFFGGGIVSGYVRPKDDEVAARLAEQPVPTSIRQLHGGVMQLPRLPVGPGLDVNKGLRFRIRRPNPHKVAVSRLRSAYLLLFSLLGNEGYRYAKSGALRPIREQIMNPDEVRIKGCLGGDVTGLDSPVDPVIMLNYGCDPSFWAVKIGDKCVFLPCGGPIKRFRQLTREPIALSVRHDRSAFWASRQFRNESVLSFGLNMESDVNDIDFLGGRFEVQTDQGNLWEWIIVDHQGNEVISLPFRPKGVEQEGDTGGVIMMLGKDEFMGRKDRRMFAAVSPRKLLSLTVDLKDGKKE